MFKKTQESWREEIKTHITHFKLQQQKRLHEFQLKEEHLIRKRENELKHIQDVREHYESLIGKANQLYLELSAVLWQVGQHQRQEYRKREMKQNKRKLMQPFMKLQKRRWSQNSSTTPTSPDCSLTSPDSPKAVGASRN